MLGTVFVKFLLPVLALFPLSAAVAVLADAADAAQHATVQAQANNATGLSLVAIIMATVQGVFLWLGRREDNTKERDRLMYDRKFALLEDKVTTQAEQIVELRAGEVACELREKQLREQLAQQQLEMQEDRYEIADLRWRLDNRSGEHPALPPDRRRKQEAHPGPDRRKPPGVSEPTPPAE